MLMKPVKLLLKIITYYKRKTVFSQTVKNEDLTNKTSLQYKVVSLHVFTRV
jgi:hypothetical protein